MGDTLLLSLYWGGGFRGFPLWAARVQGFCDKFTGREVPEGPLGERGDWGMIQWNFMLSVESYRDG